MSELIRRMALGVAALAMAGCMDRAQSLEGTGGSGAVEEAVPQDTTDDLESGATTSGSPTDSPSAYDRPASPFPGTPAPATGGAGQAGGGEAGSSGAGAPSGEATTPGGEAGEVDEQERGLEEPQE